MSVNNNYLLKQQISNLKKQASKRYNSSVRGGNTTQLISSGSPNAGAYGVDVPIQLGKVAVTQSQMVNAGFSSQANRNVQIGQSKSTAVAGGGNARSQGPSQAKTQPAQI